MKRYIVILMLLLPLCAHAEIPAIATLGAEASKNRDVEHMSIGSFMIGTASTFASKEQRAVFKMLDNIEMIECRNSSYAPHLVERTLTIIEDAGAKYIATHDDGKAINELYGIATNDIINELIIIIKSHTGGIAIVAMSGEIPLSRLSEIALIKR